jgi:hypothetical protein
LQKPTSFIHSFIHKYLQNAFSVPHAILEDKDAAVDRTKKSLTSWNLYSKGQTDNKGGDKEVKQAGVVVHTCNPSYSGGRGRKIPSSRPGQARLMRLYLKTKIQTKVLEDMAQVI